MTIMTNKLIASIMLSMSLVACSGSDGANASTPAASTTQKPKVQIDFGATILSAMVGSYSAGRCDIDQNNKEVPATITIRPDFTLIADAIGVSEKLPTLDSYFNFNRRVEPDGQSFASFVYHAQDGVVAPIIGFQAEYSDSASLDVRFSSRRLECLGHSPDPLVGLRTKSAYQIAAKFFEIPKRVIRCRTNPLSQEYSDNSYELKDGIVKINDKVIFDIKDVMYEALATSMLYPSSLEYNGANINDAFVVVINRYGDMESVSVISIDRTKYYNCNNLI